MAFSDNDKAALAIAHSMCFIKHIHTSFLLKTRRDNDRFQTVESSFGNLNDLNVTLHLYWQHLGDWHCGIDITKFIKQYGLSMVFYQSTLTERNNQGMLDILHQIFEIDGTVGNIDKQYKLFVLMDLWRLGEDITHFALSL